MSAGPVNEVTLADLLTLAALLLSNAVALVALAITRGDSGGGNR